MSEASENQYNREDNNDRENMQAEESHTEGAGTPRWVWLSVIVLAAVSVLGVGVGWNATTQAKRAEQALATQTGQNKLVGQDLQALNQRLTQTEEIQRRSHLPRARVRIVVFAMTRMASAKTFRNQVFDGLAEQLDLGVTEQLRRPRVRTTNYACGVRDKNRVGRNIE